MRDGKVGDVIRVDRLLNSVFGGDVINRGTTWCQITEVIVRGEYRVHWLFRNYPVGVSAQVDTFEIVPPEKWPTKVIRRVAERALMNEGV